MTVATEPTPADLANDAANGSKAALRELNAADPRAWMAVQTIQNFRDVQRPRIEALKDRTSWLKETEKKLADTTEFLAKAEKASNEAKRERDEAVNAVHESTQARKACEERAWWHPLAVETLRSELAELGITV